jgi:F-type H+-transporting ATPase subunit a
LFVAPFGNHFALALQFPVPVGRVDMLLSHSLRLFGNIYAGEIIFLLLGMWAASGIYGTLFSGVLNWAGRSSTS